MNEIDLNSGLVGALIPTFAGVIVYFMKKQKKNEEDTLKKIVARLENAQEKEVAITGQLSAIKAELQMFGSSYAVVTSAAEKIILLKNALDAAFRKIDELRESIDSLQTIKSAIEYVELSNDDNARLVIGRIHLLKRAIEGIGGVVDKAGWVDPDKIEDLKQGE